MFDDFMSAPPIKSVLQVFCRKTLLRLTIVITSVRILLLCKKL